ncbi:hypothetical protein [Vallitalea guaymasensis]|uniref:hypothetical protein n=1 Tax=Vallitalea guaymasensis TaxID=1185412 RepID=UPI0023540CE2|nr:hypothetical protein [Vallitalea guaymasensis]
MKKIVLLVIITIAGMLFLLFKNDDSHEVQITINKDLDLFIRSTNGFAIKVEEKNSTEYTQLINEETNFSVYDKKDKIGSVAVINKKIGKENIFFLKANGESKEFSLDVRLRSKMKVNNIIESLYDNNDLMEFNNKTNDSININNESQLYLDGENYSIRLGNPYYVEELGHSVIDVISNSNGWNINSNKGIDTKIQLDVKDNMETNLEAIISTNKLVDFEDNDTLDLIRRLDLYDKKIFRSDGIYYNIANNYIPYGRESKWNYPSGFPLIIMYENIKDNNLFRLVGISLLYDYIDKFNEDYYIPSLPRSTWLYEDYNIDYEFYDTRFNTDTIMALIYWDQIIDEPRIKEIIDNYFSFFIDYAYVNNWKTDNDGLFIPDYKNKDEKISKTHCSLNHLVSEINAIYIYDKYYNCDNKYIILAEQMQQAIIDTYIDWIKDNNDFWYCIKQNGEYGLTDYRELTLKDMKLLVDLLNERGETVPKEFNKLIESKTKWLENN